MASSGVTSSKSLPPPLSLGFSDPKLGMVMRLAGFCEVEGRERDRVLDFHLRGSAYTESALGCGVEGGLGRFLHEEDKHFRHHLLLGAQPVVACC